MGGSVGISKRRLRKARNFKSKKWWQAAGKTLTTIAALLIFLALSRFVFSQWLPEIDAENLVEESGARLAVERVATTPDGTPVELSADYPPPRGSGEFEASLNALSRLSLLAKEILTVGLGATIVALTEWSARAWLHAVPADASRRLRILALLGTPVVAITISALFLTFGTVAAIGLWEGEGELISASIDTSTLTLATSFFVGLTFEVWRKRAAIRSIYTR